MQLMIFPATLVRQMAAVATLLSVSLLHAQNLEQLQDSFKSDLESALTVLSASQKKIADEKRKMMESEDNGIYFIKSGRCVIQNGEY